MNDTQVLSGKWTVGHEQEAFDGNLHVNENERFITLEILIPMMQERKTTTFPHRGKIPFITGTLLTGAKVLLYDCETGSAQHQVPLYTRIYIYARYAFWGLSADCFEQPLFKGASVDFGDILNWYDLCRYEDLHEKDRSQGYLWKTDGVLSFAIDDNLSLAFSSSTNGYFGKIYKRELTLKQAVWVNFNYKQDVPWEVILQDIQKVKYLVGLGLNQRIEIDSIKYKHQSIFTVISEQSGERYWNEADVLLGTGKVEPTQHREKYEFLFGFKDFLTIENGIKKWFHSYDRLKPILDLYYSVFGQINAVETAFLCLMQALETYHARFVASTIGQYKKRVEKLVSVFPDEETKELWSRFLLDEGQKKSKGILLKSRLSDLYFADGHLPLMRTGDLPPEIIQKITDSRNYYTHYEEKKKDLAYRPDELLLMNGYLACLLRYYFLCCVGFDPEFAKKAIDDEVTALHRYERTEKAIKQG